MTKKETVACLKMYKHKKHFDSTHQVIQVKTQQLSPCPSQEQVGFLKPKKHRNPIENEQREK